MAMVGGRQQGPRAVQSGSAFAGVPAVGAALLATVAILSYDLDPWGAIGLPLLLSAITVPLLLRTKLARVDGLGGILVAGLVFKFAGGFLKYIGDFDWYGGRADTFGYHRTGAEIAEQFRSGRIGLIDLVPTSQGTPFIGELSGALQSLFGSSIIGNYLTFAWLAFIGLVALLAAAKTAVPGLNLRRYAILLLFLPSVAFWGAGISKDAWMLLAIGLFALGAAQVFVRQLQGFIYLALGLLGMSYVRPHLALLASAAFAVALVVGRRSQLGGRSSSPAIRVVGLIVVVGAFAFTVAQASGLLPGFSPDGSVDLRETLETTQRRSSYGGSEIDVAAPNNPLQYPYAFATVMLRPFLFEASNFNALLSAVEGTVLIGLFFAWRRDALNAVRRALREPYLMMAGLYTLAFGFAWASVGNLGIIVRQRTQVIAFLLLFLCVPAALDQIARRRGTSSAREAAHEAP